MSGRLAWGRELLLSAISIVLFLLILEVSLRTALSDSEDYYAATWEYSRGLKEVVSDKPFLFDHKSFSTSKVYDTVITLNSRGMRDQEYQPEKPEGIVRIAAVGDSTTLGWGVSSEETYTEVLERMLNDREQTYEVLNFGVGNYNTFQEYQKIQRDVLPFQPDTIILQFYTNDLEGLQKPTFYCLKENSYTYFFLWRKLIGVKNAVKGYDGETYYRELYSEDNKYLDENKKALEDIVSLASEQNITLFILLIPELQTFDPSLSDLQTAFVKEVIGDKGEVVDSSPEFLRMDPEEFHISEEDVHLNAEGHRILAQTLYSRISEEG